MNKVGDLPLTAQTGPWGRMAPAERGRAPLVSQAAAAHHGLPPSRRLP